MGKLLLIACTNVGRYIIEEVMNNSDIKTQLVGVVNLNSRQGADKANYDSYSDLAVKYNIDIAYCDNVNDLEILEWIKGKSPDVIVQSGWSQKFSNALLKIPEYCCIGEHPAPLPRGRGAACVNWAILTGETQWGDTFFEMVEQYDKGCILAQEFFNIEKYDSVYTVYEKVAKTSCDIIRKYIDKWSEGIFDRKQQSDEYATYYKRRRPTDGEITDFNQSAEVIHDFVRAQAVPYPCAYIMADNKKLKILGTDISDEFSNEAAGTVLDGVDGALGVVCKDGKILKVIRVQMENQPSCWAKDCEYMQRRIGESILSFN